MYLLFVFVSLPDQEHMECFRSKFGTGKSQNKGDSGNSTAKKHVRELKCFWYYPTRTWTHDDQVLVKLFLEKSGRLWALERSRLRRHLYHVLRFDSKYSPDAYIKTCCFVFESWRAEYECFARRQAKSREPKNLEASRGSDSVLLMPASCTYVQPVIFLVVRKEECAVEKKNWRLQHLCYLLCLSRKPDNSSQHDLPTAHFWYFGKEIDF